MLLYPLVCYLWSSKDQQGKKVDQFMVGRQYSKCSFVEHQLVKWTSQGGQAVLQVLLCGTSISEVD